ncbi:MAG: UbiD family decarboxylase domain-containing protein, partial [Holophagaceae bacterium]
MGKDLKDFINRLEERRELHRIRVEVDPYLEMGAIAEKIMKSPQGGSALLFEKPKGHSIPVLMNMYGSARRIQMALGVDEEPRGLDAIADRIKHLIQEAMPKQGTSFFDKLAKLPLLAEVGEWMPRTVSSGACQEVIYKGSDATLDRLPILTTWPEDGGPYITFGMSHTKNKQTGHRNTGLYRLQKKDS